MQHFLEVNPGRLWLETKHQIYLIHRVALFIPGLNYLYAMLMCVLYGSEFECSSNPFAPVIGHHARQACQELPLIRLEAHSTD